jgi:transcriptional repressor NrdR
MGELVMGRLRDLDKVAFVRFASVYRQFEDVDEFMDELRGLIGQRGEKGPLKSSEPAPEGKDR